VSLRARRAWQSVVASEARQSQPFLMRLLHFIRNDILSKAFISVLFTSFVPENIGDLYFQ